MQVESIYLLKNKVGFKVEFNSISYIGDALKREWFRKAKVKKAKSKSKGMESISDKFKQK